MPTIWREKEKSEFAYSHPAEVAETVKRGQAIYVSHSWSRQRITLLNAIGDLLHENRRGQTRSIACVFLSSKMIGVVAGEPEHAAVAGFSSYSRRLGSFARPCKRYDV